MGQMSLFSGLRPCLCPYFLCNFMISISQKRFPKVEKKLKKISETHLLIHIDQYKIGSTPILEHQFLAMKTLYLY